MRIRKLNDTDVLDTIAVSYRLHRVLNKRHNLPALQSSIITLIGSYANRPSDVLLGLSVPELQALLSYNRTSSERLYYAVKVLCEGAAPYLQKHSKNAKEAATYSLTARGIEVVREALNLVKLFRYECAQIAE